MVYNNFYKGDLRRKDMELINKILLGVPTLEVINFFGNAYKSDFYMEKIKTISEQYTNVMNEVNALEKIKKDVPGIMNANGVLEYICEKQITADRLKKEEEFYRKKFNRFTKKAFVLGYFTD